MTKTNEVVLSKMAIPTCDCFDELFEEAATYKDFDTYLSNLFEERRRKHDTRNIDRETR